MKAADRRTILSFILVLIMLSGCAGPLTTPPGIVGCSIYLHPGDGGVLDRPIARAMERQSAGAPGEAPVVNLLLLSGGGKYGAYGAGVLSGWSEAEADGSLGSGNIRRSDFDIVTGISTGALLTTFVVAGNAATTPEERAKIDADMRAAYDVRQSDLLVEGDLIGSIRSNGLADIRGRLDRRLQDAIERYWDTLRAIPPDRQALVGVVNLTNGGFYIADLLEIARSGAANAKDCYREIILASAAVPVQFPPRFIDGHPYVDGGVRFGIFLGRNFGERARARAASGQRTVTVNFRAIVNGNLSANAPDDEPARAAACDSAELSEVAGACEPVRNDILSIATRSAAAILVDQIYRSSARALYLELEHANVLGPKRGYMYVPNAKIALKDCRRATKDGFDRQFMACLLSIGIEDGRAQQWVPVEDLPREASVPVDQEQSSTEEKQDVTAD